MCSRGSHEGNSGAIGLQRDYKCVAAPALIGVVVFVLWTFPLTPFSRVGLGGGGNVDGLQAEQATGLIRSVTARVIWIRWDESDVTADDAVPDGSLRAEYKRVRVDCLELSGVRSQDGKASGIIKLTDPDTKITYNAAGFCTAFCVPTTLLLLIRNQPSTTRRRTPMAVRTGKAVLDA